MHFLYVLSEEGRDWLVEHGYNLLKSDDRRHVYVFENSNKENFAALPIDAVFSDTLTL